jgi:hypothetical protein
MTITFSNLSFCSIQETGVIEREEVLKYISQLNDNILYNTDDEDLKIYVQICQFNHWSRIYHFDNFEEYSIVLDAIKKKKPTNKCNIKHIDRLKYSTVNGQKLYDFLNIK